MSGRYIGRFSVLDGEHRRVSDTALRTHVASFHGPSFVAEREGQDLRVHMLHDEHGRPVQENVLHHQEGNSGIRSSSAGGGRDAGGVGGISSIAELNAMNSKHYAGIGVRRRA
jgi:hypothetical protein